MKKFWKRTVAAVLAAFMAMSCTACSSEDATWAAKRGEETIPIGAYIYYLFTAYNEAASQVEDSSASILSQTIDGENAETWITNRAVQNVRNLFLVDERMQEMNLSLSEEEQQQIESSANTQWTYMGSILEDEFGIAKSSFELAGPAYTLKSAKIFNALYGPDGTSPVPQEDVEAYFEENYTSYAYLIRPLYKTSDTGEEGSDTSSASSEIIEMTDEEIAAAKQEFDYFATQISNGDLTMQQAAAIYQELAELDTDPLSESVEILSEDTGLPTELVTLVDGLNPGEAGTTEVSLGTQKAYILAVKYDISDETYAALQDEATYNTILVALRGDEFNQMIEDDANSLDDIEINESAMRSYSPSMFE